MGYNVAQLPGCKTFTAAAGKCCYVALQQHALALLGQLLIMALPVTCKAVPGAFPA